MAHRSREDEIIQKYFAPLSAEAPGAFALLDDAATLPPLDGEDWVTTLDTLVEGVHFFASDHPVNLAIKALGVNLSDLAAKGAIPKAYMLSLALPKQDHTEQEKWLKGFATGLKATQEKHHCHLIGGDTVASPGPLAISVTAFGAVPKNGMLTRSGAKPGDAVILTGTIGDSFLGLTLRQNEALAKDWGIDGEECDYLKWRYLNPQPRTPLASALQENASAAIDISDGFIGDFHKLCEASSVGGRIDGAKILLSDSARTLVANDPTYFEKLLTGGDDYEILAAVPPENLSTLIDEAQNAGIQISKIGDLVPQDEGIVITGLDGRELKPVKQSYAHF